MFALSVMPLMGVTFLMYGATGLCRCDHAVNEVAESTVGCNGVGFHNSTVLMSLEVSS